MSGTTGVWFRCLCSNSSKSLEDRYTYFVDLKGAGVWPSELTGTYHNCDRSFVARHIHRENDILLDDQEARTSELGVYTVRLRGSEEPVGVVTGTYNIDGDE